MEEFISSHLDGEPIDSADKAGFDRLMADNSAFRETYRAVELARTTLRASRDAVRTPAPADLRASVLAALQQEAQTGTTTVPPATRQSDTTPRAATAQPADGAQEATVHRLPGHQSSEDSPGGIIRMLWRYRLSAAAVLAAVIAGYIAVDYYTERPAFTAVPAGIEYLHLPEDNYRLQSYSNFAAVKQGKLSVHKATSSYTELEKFFRAHGVTYDLIPPEMPAELLGGVISEHSGHKMAHLVFQHNGTLIYMYQAPREAFSSHTVDVEDKVLYIVDHGAWYWEETGGNGTLAIWEKGATVCAIVADLKPETLQSLLQHKG